MLNAKVCFRYAVGAVLSIAAAIWIGGWRWLLLWLALSFVAQALAYAGMGSVVFWKKDGRLPWTVRILLAPYMLLARLVLYYYCRGLPAYAEVAPGVWIGRRLTTQEAEEMVKKGVTASLDLTAGFPEAGPLRDLKYSNIQLLPITAPSLPQLQDGVSFIRDESRKGIVYVHGALGYSRSVGFVAAYLLAAGLEPSVEKAVARVRAVTPQTLLDEVWIGRLHEFTKAQ